MQMPNDAEKAAVSQRLKEVANIIRNGVFAGGYAPAVAAALQWLDSGASFFGSPPPEQAPAPAPTPAPETPAPDLKVVPDEQK